MDLRFYLALLVGKLTTLILKFTGSGATAAPGLYALYIDPNLVKKFSTKLKNGSIIVSGTNGKTTTARLIFEILSTKYKIIHNRQGSNLLRGIASTLISKSSIAGSLDFDLGLWETDEAVLPQVIGDLKPKTIVLLNLFRDQLDRYGEIDTIRYEWQKALEGFGPQTQLILNADDPGIYFLNKFFKGHILTFGIEDTKINLPQVSHVSDIKYCPNCNSKINFATIFFSHIGHYFCSKCDFKRSTPSIYAKKINFKRGFSTTLNLSINKKISKIHLKLPGLYNVYNILAASTVGRIENIDKGKIVHELGKFSTAFGRFQSVKLGNKLVTIFLIKNPTGANEVLRTLSLEKNLNILTILNDKFADGTDVSWIWDTDWEIISNQIKSIIVSGIRSWDLANRFKYAGIKLSKKNVYNQINYSIKKSLSNLGNNDTLIILPTYTALLEVQQSLTKLGGITKWHQD